MVRIWVASLHQKTSTYENTLRFLFYLKFYKAPQGWIRTAAALSQKTAQKQPSATATTAASGRSREELLGLRPAGCACRPRHDAAAGSRDPGSFLFCAARVIHPRPPKNPLLVHADGEGVLTTDRFTAPHSVPPWRSPPKGPPVWSHPCGRCYWQRHRNSPARRRRAGSPGGDRRKR